VIVCVIISKNKIFVKCMISKFYEFIPISIRICFIIFRVNYIDTPEFIVKLYLTHPIFKKNTPFPK
jgi:hypothetical protein